MKYLSILFFILIILAGCASSGGNADENSLDAETAIDELASMSESEAEQNAEQIPAQSAEQLPAQSTEPLPEQRKINISTDSKQNINDKRVLVNQEVMTYIEQLKNENKDIEQLIFYLSKSFTMGIAELNNLPKVEIIERLLLVSEKDQMQPIAFTCEQIGTTRPHLISINDDVITINFQIKDEIVPLGFKKNLSENCYDLYTIRFDSALFEIQSEAGNPKLYIYASIERGNQRIVTYDVKGVPVFSNEDTRIERSAEQQVVQRPPESETQVQPQQQTQRQPWNNNILSAGSLRSEVIVDYVKSKTRNPALNDANIRRLINLYLSEAALEDVNHDIAIAQMLYWTNNLANRERVETNNFGGLSQTREWRGRFPYDTLLKLDGMTEGVRAHIQHLRLYASNTLKNASTINVDPRFLHTEEFSQRINTFDGLYEKCTQNIANYRQKINVILSDLHRFSDRYR